MKENQASFTAMVTAYIRAYHSMHATNKIFDDFLAHSLIPEEIRTLIEQHLIIDKQLNNPEHAESQSDQVTAFESLIKTNNIMVLFFLTLSQTL